LPPRILFRCLIKSRPGPKRQPENRIQWPSGKIRSWLMLVSDPSSRLPVSVCSVHQNSRFFSFSFSIRGPSRKLELQELEIDFHKHGGFAGVLRSGAARVLSLAEFETRTRAVTATSVSVPTRRVTGTVTVRVGPCCLPVSRTFKFCAESRCPSRVVYAVRVALSESHRPSRRAGGAVPTILSVRVAPSSAPRHHWQLEHPSGQARRRPMLAVHQMSRYFVV
jgi:hypothetical protein